VGLIEIVVIIVIGFVVGLIARFLTPGRDALGFILTTIVGIGGAFLATWVGQTLDWYQPGETAGFLGAIVGAIVILLLLRAVRRR
jgi:uncharacterized membrane protein YeaQ/YmgE (transglycosylase-associated protein family)